MGVRITFDIKFCRTGGRCIVASTGKVNAIPIVVVTTLPLRGE